METQRQPKPRGGAAKEIRTGHFIKAWLEKVDEDSITGIHGALSSEIGRRPAGRLLRLLPSLLNPT